jgi:hypothetical protein
MGRLPAGSGGGPRRPFRPSVCIYQRARRVEAAGGQRANRPYLMKCSVARLSRFCKASKMPKADPIRDEVVHETGPRRDPWPFRRSGAKRKAGSQRL